MVEEAEALARILAAAEPLETEARPLLEAVGFFLAAPLRAALAHPRFANSVVDGYALRVEDGLAPRKIIGEQAAGRDLGWSLAENEALRIFTGAPIPQGCTGVIMQEDVAVVDGEIAFQEPVAAGENIRPAGADLAAGQLIGRAGQRITPQLAGLLASQGMASCPVRRRPAITVLSTGDELRPPWGTLGAGGTLAAGEIYDSNSVLLAALLQQTGLAAATLHCPDDPLRLRETIRQALAASDVLIISGGVSVGDHDQVRPALKALGVQLELWRIRMKPGKPLAFARWDKKLIFGLPGNPVASFVTFQVLLRPALRQMLGARGEDRFLPKTAARLSAPASNPGERPHYLRGTVAHGAFVAQGLQESHAIFGLSQSNALLRLAPGETLLEGAPVEVVVW